MLERPFQFTLQWIFTHCFSDLLETGTLETRQALTRAFANMVWMANGRGQSLRINRAVPHLIRALMDENVIVRGEAACALKEWQSYSEEKRTERLELLEQLGNAVEEPYRKQ